MSILSTQSQSDCLMIQPLRHRIDASNAIQFRDELLALIQQGHHRLIIDLEQVQFIDSSGLGMLVGVMKTLPDRSNMVLCHMHDSVLGVFRLTRMDKVFHIVANPTDALDRLSA